MFNRVRSLSISSGDMDALVPHVAVEQLPTELREMYEHWRKSEAAPGHYPGSVAESDWPLSIYVPERYEEGYAYPLILWFHSNFNDEDQLEQVMNAVSSQNYIGLALRGNRPEAQGGFSWNGNCLQFGSVPLLDLLHLTTCRLRKAFHIHSERIFLAGSGFGADVALQTLVQRPDWFAGAVLLDPSCSRECLNSDRLTGLRNKPVMMSVSRTCAPETLARCVESVRTLRSSGASVDVEITNMPVDPVSAEARMIDHWIMNCINREALV